MERIKTGIEMYSKVKGKEETYVEGLIKVIEKNLAPYKEEIEANFEQEYYNLKEDKEDFYEIENIYGYIIENTPEILDDIDGVWKACDEFAVDYLGLRKLREDEGDGVYYTYEIEILNGGKEEELTEIFYEVLFDVVGNRGWDELPLRDIGVYDEYDEYDKVNKC